MDDGNYNIRINHLHFLGMIRKKFEERPVWDRVVAEPYKGDDDFQTGIMVKLYFKEDHPHVDIFQSTEKSWLADYHVSIENVHPREDCYELMLRIN